MREVSKILRILSRETVVVVWSVLLGMASAVAQIDWAGRSISFSAGIQLKTNNEWGLKSIANSISRDSGSGVVSPFGNGVCSGPD